MNFNIIPARHEHLPALEELENACFSLPWSRKMLENQMLSESSVLFVAESYEGDLLGYAGFSYVLDEGYISNIATAPPFRRLGVADTLIIFLMKRARELGLSFLTLEVRESNAAATALYKKHGFILVGLRKNYYEKPRDNALLMTLFL